MKKLALIILIAGLFSLQHAQPLSPQEREILQLQDQRSLGGGKLVSYLKNPNVQLRVRAVIALANLQDTSTVGALTLSLNDNDKDVRAASALALGQMRTGRAADVLFSAVAVEKDSTVLAGILEATGKCGSSKYLDSLLRFIEIKPDIFPPKAFAMCIARFAIRQIRTERSLWKCFEYVGNETPEVCSAALYALWRSAPNGLIDLEISKHKDELVSLAKSSHADIRMQLATLLGRSKTNDSREILDTLEQTETMMNDWHVWVQIVRSRAALTKIDELLAKYPEYLSAKNDHQKIAALQALSTVASPLAADSEFIDSLRLTLTALVHDHNEVEAVRGESLVALGKHFPKELELFLPWLTDHQGSPWLKAKLLESIAERTTKEHLMILRQNLSNASARVAMAAWDYLRPMLAPADIKKLGLDSNEQSSLTHDVFTEAITAFKKNDIGVTTVVANLFADTMVFKSIRNAGLTDQIVDACISAFENLPFDDVEAKQSLLQALGAIHSSRAIPFLEHVLMKSDRAIAVEAADALHRITGGDYSSRLPAQTIAPRTEEDWKLLERINPHQRIRIVTNRGELTLELLKEHAPFTVLSVVKLINKEFYNGLNFHRVIPDFVVQGGDPRGDGWGGPGYTIRTELSTAKYDRGSCGMASAGKDTEGSQFFITHIATPHLDGRYTIFGRVVSGMDVVDRLQIGDVMKTVQLVQE